MTTESSNQKELPISREELARMTGYLHSINTEIGTIIKITKEIWEIVGTLYKEDQIFAKEIEVLGHNLFKIEFMFPKFESIKIEGGHVSITQMGGAIVQGLFMSIGLAIKQNGLSSPLSYETFLLNRGEVLYRRDARTMRKKLKFDEKCYLIFKVREFIKKGNTYSLVTDIIKDKNTFLDGYVECVVQDQYLFDEEKKKYIDPRSVREPSPQTMVGNVRTRFETNENVKDIISMTDKTDDLSQ